MNLLRAAGTVSGLTLLSRITGLARDTLLARAFGASIYTDAFWVAFRIPNLLRRLFAEGAFSQAFVPILGEYKTRRGDAETRVLIDRVATLLTWALVATAIAGIVLSPLFVFVIGSGLSRSDSPDGFDAAVLMTRIMFPYIVCMSLVALSAGILNTWSRFSVPAFTPVLLNLAMIAGAWIVVPGVQPPILVLAGAVMLGGVLQLALQVPVLARQGLLPRISWSVSQAWGDAGVRRVLGQMLPATLGVSVAQLSIIVNTNIATWLAAGSVTWLQFADRLMEFPTALLGVALGTVLIPSLSRSSADDDPVEFSSLLDWGLRLTLLLAAPAAVGLATLSEGLAATLFHYGRFGARDVAMTQSAIIAYGVGLVGLVSVKVLAPGFYARQDIRTPVKIALVVLAATQLMNLAFVPLFRHAGLALSISLGACINALWLLHGLRRRGLYRASPGWAAFMVRLGAALAVMALLLWWCNRTVPWLALQAHAWERIGWLALLVAGGAASYFAVLALVGVRPSQFVKRAG